jgi:tetratricopeptide (TPR) repeat protein
MRNREGYQAAKEHLKGFLLERSPEKGELWNLLGRCEAELGNYEAAEEYCKKAIEVSPDAYRALKRLMPAWTS